MATATTATPYTPLGALFGFVPLPRVFLMMGLIVLACIASAERAKRWFYRHVRG